MKKTFTIEQILALKQALESAGLNVEKGIQLDDPETFTLKVNGTVAYSGRHFSGTLTVSYHPIMAACYNTPRKPAPAGGIIAVINNGPGAHFHSLYKAFRILDPLRIAALFEQVTADLDRSAKWDEMWDAWVKARRERNYTDNYKTRFLHKYADEHFPGLFFTYRKGNRK